MNMRDRCPLCARFKKEAVCVHCTKPSTVPEKKRTGSCYNEWRYVLPNPVKMALDEELRQWAQDQEMHNIRRKRTYMWALQLASYHIGPNEHYADGILKSLLNRAFDS